MARNAIAGGSDGTSSKILIGQYAAAASTFSITASCTPSPDSLTLSGYQRICTGLWLIVSCENPSRCQGICSWANLNLTKVQNAVHIFHDCVNIAAAMPMNSVEFLSILVMVREEQVAPDFRPQQRSSVDFVFAQIDHAVLPSMQFFPAAGPGVEEPDLKIHQLSYKIGISQGRYVCFLQAIQTGGELKRSLD